MFHIPQAQAYCANRFSIWDPKLTTPAGLYLLTYPLSFLRVPCSPALLRSANAFGVSLLLPVISYRILRRIHPDKSPSAAAHEAVNVALFPILWFFASLYYTDVYSTVFVLASYWAWLNGSIGWSAVASWVGLWFRQTNVLWTAFLVVLEIGRTLEGVVAVEEVKEKPVLGPKAGKKGKKGKKRRSVKSEVDEKERVEEDGEFEDGPWTIDIKSNGTAKCRGGGGGGSWDKLIEPMRKVRLWNPVFDDEVLVQGISPPCLGTPLSNSTLDFFLRTPTTLFAAALANLPLLILSTLPYLLVLASFGVFIFWNNLTIALGDKSAHQPTLHIPQLYYFSLFSLITSLPLLMSPTLISRFWHSNVHIYLRKNRNRKSQKLVISSGTLLRTALILTCMLVTVWKNTYFHPYLLADNRHYVFYIFRRTLLLHPLVRYIVNPLYFVSAWAVFDALRVSRAVSVLWVYGWAVAVIGTLIGAGLVEFRYFALAWVVWRLNVRVDETWRRCAETVGFLGVNFVTVWIFAKWGFEWRQERGKVQRFMW